MGFGVSGPWSIRKREGSRTPSVEEFLYYHFIPGGFYKTAIHEDGLESEYFDYMVLSGLAWYGSIAYALNAIEAARVAGTTATFAEWTVWRNIRALQIAAHAAPYLAATAAGTYLGMQAVEESGIVEQTLDIAQGTPSKPWWMPLPVYIAMYS